MKEKIRNRSLREKILAIVLLGVFVMAITAWAAIEFLNSSFENLFYQTLSQSLSYSSKEIYNYLNKMEKLSMMILSDESVQNDLALMRTDDIDSLTYMNALSRIRASSSGYYQTNADGILEYISIYTPTATICTNTTRAKETSIEVELEVLNAASQKAGAPAWVYDERNPTSLFLGRSINHIAAVKRVPIGSLLFRVDMEALVEIATQFEHRYEKVGYIISSNNEIIFKTDNLSTQNTNVLRGKNIGAYGIVEMDDDVYFAIQGSIPYYNWEYYCLVSYGKIAKQIKNAKLFCILIIIMDALLMVALSSKLISSLIFHVKTLVDKMHRFSLDNTKTPTVDYDYSQRHDELGVLHQQFDVMSQNLIDLNQKNYVSEILKQEAQIKALEHQMNPHFLYNTLDSIRWRAKAVGEKDIYKMVEALALLLRASLSKQSGEDSTLGEEMEIVAAYITIQKTRYEERLVFENNIPDYLLQACVQKLIIQPLVENAVYYGLEVNVDVCHIQTQAYIKNKTLNILVKNTNSEFEDDLLEKLQGYAAKTHGHGIGLLNIHNRLRLQFGEKYGLSLYNDDDYAIAHIVLPLGFCGGNNAKADDC